MRNLPDVEHLKSMVKNEINKLSKTDLEKRIFLRKLTGIDSLNGMLDYLPRETALAFHDELVLPSIDDHGTVIAPLHMDELADLYRACFKSCKNVFPVTHPILSSKYYRNMMFGEYSPRSIYIPEFCFPKLKHANLSRVFLERGIQTVMIKDEFGFHGGQSLPYIVTPSSKIDEYIPSFVKKACRVEGIGGMVIDEFIGDVKSEVYKCHVFGEFIPDEVLKYTVTLDSLEGVFKSHDASIPDLLKRVEIQPSKLRDDVKARLTPAIEKYLPYAFTSIDFMIEPGTGDPIVIDVNSKAGSLGELQEIKNTNDGNPFAFFLDKIKKFPGDEWNRQSRYHQDLDRAYNETRLLSDIKYHGL
jgi:hypothetical protein